MIMIMREEWFSDIIKFLFESDEGNFYVGIKWIRVVIKIK